jgi:hypothetical protein
VTLATFDLERAQVGERAEAAACRDLFAAATPALAETLGTRLEPFAGGVALVASAVAMVLYNRAFAFGLDQPVDEAALERVIDLFDRRGPFAIQPSPAARPAEIGRWLEARGMVARSHWVKWIRDARPLPVTHGELRIERVAAAQVEPFVAIAAEVFRHEGPLREWIPLVIGRPGWRHYLAWDGATPIGVAALHVADGAGWLGWGGTLAAHRGRGAQSALIAGRVHDAIELGCRWIVSETSDDLPEKPNPSFRNLARAGFHLLYRRPSWEPTG